MVGVLDICLWGMLDAVVGVDGAMYVDGIEVAQNVGVCGVGVVGNCKKEILS